MRSILLLLPSLFLAACADLQKVDIAVYSSDTGEAIAGADIEVIRMSGGLYDFDLQRRGPPFQQFQTSKIGLAVVELAPGQQYLIETSAAGYRSQELRLHRYNPDEHGIQFQLYLEAIGYKNDDVDTLSD